MGLFLCFLARFKLTLAQCKGNDFQSFKGDSLLGQSFNRHKMKNRTLPAEVIPSSQDARARYQQVAVGKQVSLEDIATIGAVANRGQVGSFGDMTPETLTLTYANSTSTPVNLLIFDPEGMVEALNSGTTYVKPSSWSSGLTNAVTNKFFANRPVLLKGFNYRVTTGTAAQFDNAVKYWKVSPDGGIFQKPLNIGQYQRNTQQNTLIQTVKAGIMIDQFSAVSVIVGANTTISWDLYIGEVLNSVIGG